MSRRKISPNDLFAALAKEYPDHILRLVRERQVSEGHTPYDDLWALLERLTLIINGTTGVKP